MTLVDTIQVRVTNDAFANLSESFPDVPHSVLQDAAHGWYPSYLATNKRRLFELDHPANEEQLGEILLRLSKIFVDPYGHEIPVALRTERLAELQVLGTLLDGMRPNMIRH